MAGKTFTTPGDNTGDWNLFDTLIGTGGADTIKDTGAAKEHAIYGMGGDDSLVGAAPVLKTDTLFGGAGNDTIVASSAVTAVLYADGGADNDVITGSVGGADTLLGGAGNDVITATSTAASIIDGGEGNDTLTSGAVADTVLGGAGNDVITAVGADTITGGTGNDTITLVNTAVANFASGDGQDVIKDFVAGSTLKLTPAKANLTVTATDSNITLGIKDTTDTVTFTREAGGELVGTIKADGTIVTIGDAQGANAIMGGTNIFYAGKSGTGTVDGVATQSASGTAKYDLTDTSLFYSVENFDNQANWSGSSVIRGTADANNLKATTAVSAGAAGDQLWGRAGNDVLQGGTGVDTFWYGLNEGSDTVQGQLKDDVIKLYNVNAADVSYKLSGTDLIITFANSADRLTVSNWNVAANKAKIVTADQTTPFTPTVVDGGAIVSGAATGKTVVDLNNYSTADSINNTANLTGGSVLRGSDRGNTLEATIAVGAGSTGDQLWGRLGNDTLVSGTGVDTFWYGSKEGDKVIKYGAGDIVKLYNLNIADANFSVADAAGAGGFNDLVMSFNGGDQVVVMDALDGAALTSAKFVTADRTTAFKVVAGTNVAYTKDALHVGTSATNDVLTIGAASTDRVYDLSTATSYKNIENVDATAAAVANTVVRGTDGDNMLTASNTVGTQLWGRGGADTLVGGTQADTFWVGAGEGNKTITTTAATINADTVKAYNAVWSDLSFSTAANAAGHDQVVMTIAGGNTVTLNDAAAALSNKTFKVLSTDKTTTADVVVGSSAGALTFAGADTYYFGTTSNDTLTTATVSSVIDLASSKISGVENATASAATATVVLRGNDGNNVLTASTGGTKLWGRGGNDTLVGGTAAAQDEFWFGKDEGNDIVTNYAATLVPAATDDKIMLYTTGLTTSDVAVSVSGTDVIFTIGTGTLTVKGGDTALVTNAGSVYLSDGNKYKVAVDASATSGYALKLNN